MGFGRMDVLDSLPLSDDSGSDSDSVVDERNEKQDAPGPAGPKKAQPVDFVALQKAGYKSGPSVLYLPEKKEDVQGSWNWSGGKRGAGEDSPETAAQRDQTRLAAAALDTAALAVRANEQQQQLRDAKHSEAIQLRDAARASNQAAHAAAGRGRGRGGSEKDLLSFNQREKRKRERGQAQGGKDWVQEEKRIQRQFGITSGFDM